ncbi:ParB N-terminal domain-containing protein [Streptosporangium sp. NPDC051023]|uniref:ParB N-terminal domain-containing protein n=1 Tax=Streptosporangium sp. NPDC051023 TaxID=3155410 RepID=UPI00344F00F4
MDAITIGERDRTDLGDLDELAASIAEVGLLHPVVITEARELVAGGRRLAAVRLLGWSEVPVTIVDLATAPEVLRAEADENTCRKSLTPYEASRARERRARVLAPKAKERQGRRTDLEPSAKLAEGSQADRETRKVAAVGTGYSGSTLDKVDRIRDVAERGVVRQGKAEVVVPEPVREVARQALGEVKTTGAAVEPASRRVEEALATYVQESADVQAARLRREVYRLIVQLGDGLPKLDAARVAELCDEDMWAAITAARDRLEAWTRDVGTARGPGLRVIKGEK